MEVKDTDELEKKVSKDEIFQTIKRMGSFKAPGLDGFQAIFFKSQWHVVGEDFCELVCSVFDNPSLVGETNITLLTLIPKKDVVTNMRDFRPISLCGVTYKVIAKSCYSKVAWSNGAIDWSLP